MNANKVNFLIESINTLKKIGHPNLLRYIGVFIANNMLYIHTDRYSRSLKSILSNSRRDAKELPTQMFTNLVRQFSSGLACLHDPNKIDQNGIPIPAIVHGGISPSNVLMDDNATKFVLSDAGIYSNSFGRATRYMAPELLLGERPTAASDMWSLGVPLYELLIGCRSDFLNNKNPREVFVSEWKPDLSGIADASIVTVIENLLILDPRACISAAELNRIFNTTEVFAPTIQMIEIESLRSQLEEAQNELQMLKTLMEGCGFMRMGRANGRNHDSQNIEKEIQRMKEELASFKDSMLRQLNSDIGSNRCQPRSPPASNRGGMSSAKRKPGLHAVNNLQTDLMIAAATWRT